jgi:hypothetical protein
MVTTMPAVGIHTYEGLGERFHIGEKKNLRARKGLRLSARRATLQGRAATVWAGAEKKNGRRTRPFQALSKFKAFRT